MLAFLFDECRDSRKAKLFGGTIERSFKNSNRIELAKS